MRAGWDRDRDRGPERGGACEGMEREGGQLWVSEERADERTEGSVGEGDKNGDWTVSCLEEDERDSGRTSLRVVSRLAASLPVFAAVRHRPQRSQRHDHLEAIA